MSEIGREDWSRLKLVNDVTCQEGALAVWL